MAMLNWPYNAGDWKRPLWARHILQDLWTICLFCLKKKLFLIDSFIVVVMTGWGYTFSHCVSKSSVAVISFECLYCLVLTGICSPWGAVLCTFGLRLICGWGASIISVVCKHMPIRSSSFWSWCSHGFFCCGPLLRVVQHTWLWYSQKSLLLGIA